LGIVVGVLNLGVYGLVIWRMRRERDQAGERYR